MLNFLEKLFRKMNSILNNTRTILPGSLTKYVNINIGIDFTANSNLSKDY